MTAAAVGLFAIAGADAEADRHAVVVAVEDLVPGSRLRASQLRVVDVDLPPDTLERAHPGHDLDALVGGVLLAPVAPGELVQRSAVAEATGEGTAPTPEFSFAIAEDRAVAGSLRPGEHVDVLATYGSGSGATTLVVARGATVRASDAADDATLAGTDTLTVTLALGDPTTVLALAHASQAATVTLVRTTGSAATPGLDHYRPGLDAPETPDGVEG